MTFGSYEGEGIVRPGKDTIEDDIRILLRSWKIEEEAIDETNTKHTTNHKQHDLAT